MGKRTRDNLPGRGLVRELVRRGHDVLFLERDVPWYATNRDLPNLPHGYTKLYANLGELKDSFTQTVQDADFVMVGSYVPEGVAVGEWVTATAQGVQPYSVSNSSTGRIRQKPSIFQLTQPCIIPRNAIKPGIWGIWVLTVMTDNRPWNAYS